MLDVAKIKEIPKLDKDLFCQLKRDWNLNINTSKNLESQRQQDENIAKKQITDILAKNF